MSIVIKKYLYLAFTLLSTKFNGKQLPVFPLFSCSISRCFTYTCQSVKKTIVIIHKLLVSTNNALITINGHTK